MGRLGITALSAIGVLITPLCACNWIHAPAAPPVALGCGQMQAHVTIRYKGEAPLSTTATIDDNLTDITWTAAATGTGRTIDGMTASGRSVGSGKAFTATGQGRSAGAGFTLKVTGTITGPPPRPCTGKGELAITGVGGASLASGAWTLQ